MLNIRMAIPVRAAPAMMPEAVGTLYSRDLALKRWSAAQPSTAPVKKRKESFHWMAQARPKPMGGGAIFLSREYSGE